MSYELDCPLVSICIPCYNQQQYLPSLFSSLLGQTYRNLEIIFADDCSTDNSWDVSQKYKALLEAGFPRVYMKRNEKNLGALINMSGLFKQATGDFISYLEADDYYRRDKVERNVDYLMQHSDIGAVHSDYVRLREDLTVNQGYWRYLNDNCQWPIPPTGWVFQQLLADNFVCAPALMVRRKYFFAAFDFDLFSKRKYKMGDYPALLTLAQMTKMGYIDEPLVYYRELEISMSHSPDPGEKQALLNAIARVRQDARLGLLEPPVVAY